MVMQKKPDNASECVGTDDTAGQTANAFEIPRAMHAWPHAWLRANILPLVQPPVGFLAMVPAFLRRTSEKQLARIGEEGRNDGGGAGAYTRGHCTVSVHPPDGA